jgi:serine protease AprX
MRQANERGRSERGSALWGTGAGFVCALALLASPAAALAGSGAKQAYVPATLRTSAGAAPAKSFDVIVRGRPGDSSASIAHYFTQGAGVKKLKNQFTTISGVAGSLTGADLLKLADSNHVLSIVPDSMMNATDYADQELWRTTTGVSSLWGSLSAPAPQAPAIAIIDSGVDATKLADFGTRVVASVNLSSAHPDAKGDDYGHGTMVAGLAAGAGVYKGVAQNAPIVSLRTADEHGASRSSDVIAACDWIIAHKDQYKIRVANFSLRGSHPSSFRYDPLDAAVENLWFHGVVVVAAVGNYGTGAATNVEYSPGNDPFIISVGAADTNSTVSAKDDTVASWSAFGHTRDGFAKPEIVAPGRWIIAPVPTGAGLPTTAPDRVVAPGYMWMSGTSLSAPMVAGAAAQILARHPDWSPDRVKGALMVTASRLPLAGRAAGAGELNAAKAAALRSAPAAENKLAQFVKTDATTGVTAFDADAWTAAVSANATWGQTDWDQTDWDQTDWDQTDWDQTDWDQTDWDQTDWDQTDWDQTDWDQTDWDQ